MTEPSFEPINILLLCSLPGFCQLIRHPLILRRQVAGLSAELSDLRYEASLLVTKALPAAELAPRLAVMSCK